jgi:hypothetical protein
MMKNPPGSTILCKGTVASAAFCVLSLSLNAGVTHHYRLDETFQHLPIADSAGGIDGTTPTELLRGRAGVIAGAHDFEETDGDHIDLGPNSALLPADTFTITAWIRYSPDGFDNNERILDCSDGDAFTAMSTGFNFKAQNGGLRAFVGDGTNKKATTNPQNALLSKEQWYLVALRYRASTAPGSVEDGLLQVTAIPIEWRCARGQRGGRSHRRLHPQCRRCPFVHPSPRRDPLGRFCFRRSFIRRA